MKSEAGDQRRKAYDVFPQVVVPDEFMRRVEADEDWTLVDPYEVKQVLNIDLPNLWGKEFEEAYMVIEEAVATGKLTLTATIHAKDLFAEILEAQVETGLPYIAFKDAINRANPNQHLGIIPSVNLCCESFSVVTPDDLSHSCNLASVNFANLSMDDEELEMFYLTDLAVRMLDNTIDVTTPPIASAKNHNEQLRTIGVGIIGFADYLAKRGINYTQTGVINNTIKGFAFGCFLGSVELAKERGAYPAFKGSSYDNGKLLGKTKQEHPEWEYLYDKFLKYGIRNSHVMAIAPNTSSSVIQGCTASVLPAYAKFHVENLGKGDSKKAVPFLIQHGDNYQENRLLQQSVVVEAIASMQEYIDTGISMELAFNLNPNAYGLGITVDAEHIFEVAMLAWKRGLKAIYYIRTIQAEVLSEVDGCGDSCAM